MLGVVEMAVGVQALRDSLGGQIRSMVGGEVDLSAYSGPVGDPGLFGPASVVWRVHSDSSMFVGGIRALLVQTMHPLAMAGVEEHSDYRHAPLGRLQRTAEFVGLTSFGSTESAERIIRVVRKLHDRVVGIAPDGRPYAANDPELLRWVHVSEVESFWRAYQTFGGAPLTRRESDRYFAEIATVAERLGATDVPGSVGEVRAYYREVRSELGATRQARDTARWLLAPPLPIAARGPYSVLCSAAITTLPRFIRRALWIPSPPIADALVVRPAARSLLAAMDWVLGEESEVVAAAHGRMLATA